MGDQSSDKHKYFSTVEIGTYSLRETSAWPFNKLSLLDQLRLDTWNPGVHCTFRVPLDGPLGKEPVYFWACINAVTTDRTKIEEKIKLTQMLLSEKSKKLSVLALAVFADPTDKSTNDRCTLFRDELTYALSLDTRSPHSYHPVSTYSTLANVIACLTSGSTRKSSPESWTYQANMRSGYGFMQRHADRISRITIVLITSE